MATSSTFSTLLKHNSQSGQIGVIILLIMVVLFTIGLSLAAQTTQQLFLSQQTSESTRVFNAAESGIEEGLATDLESATFVDDRISESISDIEGSNVNYTISQVDFLETRLFEGVGVKVELPDDGTTTTSGVVIAWSKESDCANQDPASLLVTIHNRNPSTGQATTRYKTMRGCDRSDGFDASSTGGNPYYFSQTLPLLANDTMLFVQPVYNDTHVKVAGNGWTLPIQYHNVRSEAVSTTGDLTRIIEVNRTLPAPPSIMNYALFSGDALVKQ